MRIKPFAAAFLALVWAMLGASAGAGLSLEQVTARLEQNFAGINTYQARFEQEVLSEQFGKVISKGRGELRYMKPGKMWWHYEQPEERYYITDGKVLWDYLPSYKQAMKMKLDEVLSSSLPKSFLFGMGKLEEQFEMAFAPDQADSNPEFYHLLLNPKKEQDRVVIGTVELFIDPKTFLVKEARLKDAVGNQNILRFSEIKVNVPMSAKIFSFTPGKGVEVIAAPEEPPVRSGPGSAGGQKTMEKGAEKK
jgi:outer membrane lipoprotein carrier protein